MTETMTDTALTAADVRALKHADSVCFDHLGDDGGRIRAILREDRSETGFEQARILPAAQSRVQDYAREEWTGPHTYTGFAMSHSAQFDDVVRTMIRHMKVGSTFSLVWTRDNNNELIRKADMHADYLHVHVQAKNAKVADVFLVDVFIGYDNTARMIRRKHDAR